MRVIAGAFGGRRLMAPRGTETRPTADRVREAMFSMIGPIDDLPALDLFAGSGALGIEALSRGAAHAVFVERNRPAVETISRNLRSLGIEGRATVLAASVERSLGRIGAKGPFGLVLVDPPYADIANGSVPRMLEALLASGSVRTGAQLIVEHGSRDAAPPLAGADVDRTRRYGDTSVTRYRVK